MRIDGCHPETKFVHIVLASNHSPEGFELTDNRSILISYETGHPSRPGRQRQTANTDIILEGNWHAPE